MKIKTFLFAFLIFFASFFLVSTIFHSSVSADTVHQNPDGSCPAGYHPSPGPVIGPTPPFCESDTSSSSGAALGFIKITLPSLGQLVSNLLMVAFLIAGIFFLVQIVLGGIMWINAGGDAKALDAARSRITNAVIGLVIVAASVSIAVIVTQALGIDIFTKAITIGG